LVATVRRRAGLRLLRASIQAKIQVHHQRDRIMNEPSMQENETEECRVYIVRKEDQKEWRAKAQNGDDVAKLCINTAGNFMRAIPNAPMGCCCCDTLFSSDDKPPAFIILVPVEEDPNMVRANARAVCSECGRHDNAWLIEQGVRREGLAPTPARPGDQIH
jgi:hypothetical protein